MHPSPLTRLPVGRPVDRYEYIQRRCVGRRVLDLGAYDETEVSRAQHGSWRWLHAQIAAVAKDVLGVDAAEEVRVAGSIETSAGTRIIYGSVDDLEVIVDEFGPDLIVAGELIEHTPDTLGWLSRLAEQVPGTDIVMTTPNATNLINIMLALGSRENNHPDHLHIYSYRTLHTLATRVPIGELRLQPYFYDPQLFYGKLPAALQPFVNVVNRVLLRPVQWIWPLSSFGWIAEGVLGKPGGTA